MNSELARVNEFRKYRKKILAQYGLDTEIEDTRNEWLIQKLLGRDIYGYMRYKILWQGQKLKDSLK